MKKIILLVIICVINTQAYSQWSMTGNAGTNATTNFIGTTDNIALKVRTNNAVRMTISNGGKVAVGNFTPVWKFDVKGGSINTDSLYRIKGIQVLKRSATNQIQIGDATATVGIGNAAPAHTLDVTGNTAITGNFVNTATTTENFGVYGSCNNTPGYGKGVVGFGGNIGVYGHAALPGTGHRYGLYADGANGAAYNYGVFASGVGGTDAIGIFATASGGSSSNFAGYFNGNVYSSGKVGIGNVTPTNTLDVTGSTQRTGNFVNTLGNSNYYGVYGSCNNTSGWGYGVYGEGGNIGVAGRATLPGDGYHYGLDGIGAYGAISNYGVYASGVGGEYAIGIYATASGGSSSNWAGYFNGNVFANAYNPSDRKLKNDIKPLSGAMSIINRLKPSVYTFKTSEYKQMNLPEGLRYGLIADELQQVLPGIVKKAVQPAAYENHEEKNGKKLNDEVEFNALNYTEIIPILIGGMKEQQAVIEAQNSEIKNLKSENEMIISVLSEEQQQKLQSLRDRKSPLRGDLEGPLFQNSPNPFSTQTEIKFQLPVTFNSAQLIITDANGKQIRSIDLKSSSSVIIKASELSGGTYSYSLVIDGVNVDAKQMILTK